MAKKINLRDSLQTSIQKEKQHIDNRFAKAETIMATSSRDLPVIKKESLLTKEKVVRDSFSIPQEEYESLSSLRMRCLKLGLDVSRSEVIRAGLKYLGQLNDNQIIEALGCISKLKPGPARRSNQNNDSSDMNV